jgi:mannose-6-phosphate isomerase-like protein (cupin superfamily)
MAKIFCKNVEKITLDNNNYRHVKYTHKKGMQFVLMSLKPGEEIGMEMHGSIDQFIRIEQGTGELQIKTKDKIKKYRLKDGSGLIIPSMTWHNIINRGKDDLKLYSIYTQSEHKDGLKQKNKN